MTQITARVIAFMILGCFWSSSLQAQTLPPLGNKNPDEGNLRDVIYFVLKPNKSFGDVKAARKLAEDTIKGNAKALVYSSTKEGDTQSFSGLLPLAPLSEKLQGTFAYGLAIFSDDGCSVSIDDKKPPIHDKFGTDQSLPHMDQSFHVIDVKLEPGSTVKLEVHYKNTIYQGKGDIDGATLFIFLVPIEKPAVTINEVSFEGDKYHQLKSDNGTTDYAAPHWVDVDGDGKATTDVKTHEKNYPVGFTRSSMPKAGGKFKVSGLSKDQTVKIRATSSQGLKLPDTIVKPEKDGSTFILPPTKSSDKLPDTIQWHNADDGTAFKIDWEMNIAPGGWRKIGSTKHTVYVTRAAPMSTAKNLMRETLFNIACRNAKGLGEDEQAVVTAIYENFKKRDVQRVKPSSGTLDGQAMKYWGLPVKQHFSTSELLTSGNGKCEAWAKLFIDILRTQGIDASLLGLYPPKIPAGKLLEAISTKFPNYNGSIVYDPLDSPPEAVLLVKKWNIIKPFAPVDLMGLPAQGMKNPQSYFTNMQ